MKKQGRKIVAVVAWDVHMAAIADQAGVDVVSVALKRRFPSRPLFPVRECRLAELLGQSLARLHDHWMRRIR
jgi:hypothetical protein